VENVAYLRSRTALPIVGLTKSKEVADDERMEKVYITPTFEDAAGLSAAGADIIAIDATERPRPKHVSFGQLVKRIHDELHKPVWADVATFDEGISAAAAGADVISTTLSGYTTETADKSGAGPDIELLTELVKQVPVPVVLEGQVWYPEQVTAAFESGAFAVVVGSAITRPQLITKRFVDAIPPSVIA
jgi:putative N-acetylmannosamine-6-phosphate epimerase